MHRFKSCQYKIVDPSSKEATELYAYVLEGKLLMMEVPSGIFFYLNNGRTKILSIAFRLPVINKVNIPDIKAFQKAVEDQKAFVLKWIARRTDLDNVTLTKLFKRYVPNFCTLSVPTVLKSELESDLRSCNIEYTILTMNTITAKCPRCKESMEVDRSTRKGQCPNCDCEFLV